MKEKLPFEDIPPKDRTSEQEYAYQKAWSKIHGRKMILDMMFNRNRIAKEEKGIFGDCLVKAVWCYYALKRKNNGVRVCRGKILDGDTYKPHAWVEIDKPDGSYLIDRTRGYNGSYKREDYKTGEKPDYIYEEDVEMPA